MTSLPGALIALNYTTDGYILNSFTSQLFIDQIWTDDEFNTIISSNPIYPDTIHLNNLRVLVLLDDFRDQTNRNLFDVVLYYKAGLVYVEKSKVGPPGQSYDLQRINIYSLLRSVGSPYVATIPQSCNISSCNCCSECKKSCSCSSFPYGRGIVAIEYRANDPSCVHAPNCDNERNNIAFKARKS